MEFPCMVYKSPGEHQARGGTFDWVTVQDAEQLQTFHANGWHDNVQAAIDALTVVDGALDRLEDIAASDDEDLGPPDRAELEQLARQLEVKFDGRTSDAKLLQRIEDKVNDVHET